MRSVPPAVAGGCFNADDPPATAGGTDLIRLLMNLRNLRMDSADEGIAAEEIFSNVSDGIVKCLTGIAGPEAKLPRSLTAV